MPGLGRVPLDVPYTAPPGSLRFLQCIQSLSQLLGIGNGKLLHFSFPLGHCSWVEPEVV